MSNDARIESLEIQVRALADSVEALMRQVSPDVIQAKGLVVLSDEGDPVVVIDADASGGVLRIHNKGGKAVASIGADAEGGVLSIGNNEGREVAAVAATTDGDGGIVTIDSKGGITSETP